MLAGIPSGVTPVVVLVLQDLVLALLDAGSLAQTLERERDALNAAILELGRLRRG